MKYIKYITTERVVIVILLAIMVFGGCWGKRKYNAQYSKIDSLTLENQQSTQIINEFGKVVMEQKVLITESQEEIKKLSDSAFDLQRKNEKKIKEVKAYYKAILQAKVDSILIEYDEPEKPPTYSIDTLNDFCKCINLDSMYTSSYLKVPKEVQLDSSGIKGSFSILQKGLRINYLSMTDTQYIRVVEKKMGIFKPRTLEIQTIHSNPSISVLGQNSVIYTPKKKSKWLERAIILGAGIVTGIYITK